MIQRTNGRRNSRTDARITLRRKVQVAFLGLIEDSQITCLFQGLRTYLTPCLCHIRIMLLERPPWSALLILQRKGASLEVSSVIGEALEAKPYIPLLYLMREVHSVANSGCTHECTPPELPEFTREIFL